MRILNKEFDDLPGVGKSEWTDGRISMSVTREQIESFKADHGLDVEEMVKGVLANEVYQSLSKVISTTVRNRKPEEIKWQKDTAFWLSSLLEKCKPLFIVTNLSVAANLQYIQQFQTKKLDNNMSANGSLYDTGTFDGVPVYVDPMMLYDEKELAIVESNFLEYEIDEEKVKLVMEGTSAPKIEINFRYKINEAKSSLYEIKELEF